jgi:CHAT domain
MWLSGAFWRSSDRRGRPAIRLRSRVPQTVADTSSPLSEKSIAHPYPIQYRAAIINTAQRPVELGVTMKILFVASRPDNQAYLRLDRELRKIEASIAIASLRKKCELFSISAARPADLMRQMNAIRPHVLHFSGHGSQRGEIILEDDTGDPHPVSPAALKAMFSVFKPELQLVVLNACYSASQAHAMAEVVEGIIAMDDAIDDRSAIAFSSSFYSALAFGRGVEEAFLQAKASLLMDHRADADLVNLIHLSDKDLSLLSIDTSHVKQLIADKHVGSRARTLLETGSRLISIKKSRDGTERDVVFVLSLRQSDVKFVVEASSKDTVEYVADRLVDELLSPELKYTREWTPVKIEKPRNQLPMYHTLEMANVRMDTEVLLLGNHKAPEWAPSAR